VLTGLSATVGSAASAAAMIEMASMVPPAA